MITALQLLLFLRIMKMNFNFSLQVHALYILEYRKHLFIIFVDNIDEPYWRTFDQRHLPRILPFLWRITLVTRHPVLSRASCLTLRMHLLLFIEFWIKCINGLNDKQNRVWELCFMIVYNTFEYGYIKLFSQLFG